MVVVLEYICHFPIEVLVVESFTLMTLGSRFFNNTKLVKKFKISKWIIPPPNNQYQKLEGFFQMSFGHPGRVFVGEANKFMDYAKSSTIEIVAFKLNYFLTSAFLH
jgi:hypothetical protein